MMPSLALSGSILVLALAVIVKSTLFSFFERRLPRIRAVSLMFLGNLLTSLVGFLVAAMIGSGPVWLIGVPLVWFLCWLPCRRLVREAPLTWLTRRSAAGLAAMMTACLLASCIFFMIGQGAIRAHHLVLYWSIKLLAIFLALLPSVTLTVIWEEWVIWRLSPHREGKTFFVSVLRSNLYVLILVMAVPAALILPKRLKSPDFLAKRPAISTAEKTATAVR